MINETGTMTGGGGRPRGGRICLGSAAPRAADTREAAAELAAAEQELSAGTQVPPHAWYLWTLTAACEATGALAEWPILAWDACFRNWVKFLCSPADLQFQR